MTNTNDSFSTAEATLEQCGSLTWDVYRDLHLVLQRWLHTNGATTSTRAAYASFFRRAATAKPTGVLRSELFAASCEARASEVYADGVAKW